MQTTIYIWAIYLIGYGLGILIVWNLKKLFNLWKLKKEYFHTLQECGECACWTMDSQTIVTRYPNYCRKSGLIAFEDLEISTKN